MLQEYAVGFNTLMGIYHEQVSETLLLAYYLVFTMLVNEGA
jgi:hypothetical protein